MCTTEALRDWNFTRKIRNMCRSPDSSLKHLKFGLSYCVLFAQPPCVFPYFLYMSHLYFRFPIYKICCTCFSFPACTPWLILLDLKRKKHKLLCSTLYRHVTFPLSPLRFPFSLCYHRLKSTLLPLPEKPSFIPITHST